MTLPVIFGGLASAAFSQLDQNFTALGNLTPIPGTLAGTNNITHTPYTGVPAFTSYPTGASFTGTVVTTNTGSVAFEVSGLPPLNVYKDLEAGPTLLSGGELVAGNFATFAYDAGLNSGFGGFHLTTRALQQSDIYGLRSTDAPTFQQVNAATMLGAFVVSTINLDVSGEVSFTSQTSGAKTYTGTLTNAPVAGNPGFWLQVSINGTTYYIPAWT